ncbi:MAG: Ig-like domain-containing protein, partial [Gemmatimonadaceae bacterium]
MSARDASAPPARRTALAALVTASALTAACASPGFPPGGPVDKAPPQLVRVTPDTGAVNARPPRVVFQFDEVVNERPQSVPTLAGLFLVSPRDGEPDVSWKRDAVTVRPHRGFRPNTVYTVTMLPGLVDLRGNVRKEGAEAIFSTGPTIPRSHVSGIVFDWPEGTIAARPLVQAISRPDSVVYVTVGDSSGRFAFPHLAPGRYTLLAAIDQNNNRALDEREAWDSAAMTLGDSARVELFAFVHDSAGPGIADLTVQDSATLRLTLDRPLDPAQPLDSSLFALRATDSTRVPLAFVRRAAAYDSARAVETGAPAPAAGQPRPAGAAPAG